MSRADPRYAEYYAIKDRREAVIAAGGCSCCASMVGREPGRAAYRWEHGNGSVSFLCVSCCAHWRANAADDPSLAPVEVRTLTPVRLCTEGESA